MAHKPDDKNRARVEALVSFGLPQTEIARELGIDPKTLRKHYEDELSAGTARANAKVAQTLFRLAVGDPSRGIDPDRACCMFWLKTRAGWRETSSHEHTIKPTPAPRYDWDKMPLEERIKIDEKLDSIKLLGDA